MNSREIVCRTIDFENPERLAFDYFAHGRRYTDIITSYVDWEYEFDQKIWVEDGREFRTDAYGNIWARVISDKATKGEIYRGVLAESWDKLDSFVMPPLSNAAKSERVRQMFDAHPHMFKSGCLINGAFETLHTLRGFANLMEDLALEPERVHQACEIIEAELVRIVEGYASCGADGIHIMEDWGTQTGLLVGTSMWDEFFAGGYTKICDAAHKHDMRVILHSCGMLSDLIGRLLSCGIDVLQFDQTANYASGEASGIEELASKYSGRVTFFCPVDIQHTLVTGDFERIEDEARRFVQLIAGKKGGFIAKSYGRGTRTYLDAIGCDPAWNDFAFECFVKYGRELFGNKFEVPVL